MKTDKNYIPQRGDIVWIDFEPQSGKEIAKRRPGLILTGREYNSFGLCLLCPITTKPKGRGLEVLLPDGERAILSDQVKSFDWRIRSAEFKEKADRQIVQRVIQKIAILLTQ